MRLAILGTRGIPANYGGFETFAEELSTRLVERGHEVTVYCRSQYTDPGLTEYRGVTLKVLPTIRHKYLDTVVHTFISALHALTKRFDAVLVCNAANSIFIPILTWTGTPVAVNVDGLERKRKKWNWAGRLYYRLGERASVWFATRVITDAAAIKDYYLSEYNAGSTMIAYGADVARNIDPAAISSYGLEPEKYILYVSRLEPENNASLVIEAYLQVETDLKLVIVGDAPYATEYKEMLRRLAKDDPRIVFTGFVFGTGYKALQQNAYAYVHATEVGGTHPALIEAMGYGNCVISLSTIENREVVGDAGIMYDDAAGLATELRAVAADSELVNDYRQKAEERVRQNYDWENVTSAYEQLFEQIGNRRHGQVDQ